MKHNICFVHVTIKYVDKQKKKSHSLNFTLHEKETGNCDRGGKSDVFLWFRWCFENDGLTAEGKSNHGASPEFISHKDDSTLQQQRGKDSYHLPYAEASEQTVKVHMLQSGVCGPPQLDDLKHHKRCKGIKMPQKESKKMWDWSPHCLWLLLTKTFSFKQRHMTFIWDNYLNIMKVVKG